MSMVHHDSRPYEVAASEAARAMREKHVRDIELARGPSRAAIERVFNEIPRDRIVSGERMDFRATDAGVDVVYAGEVVESIHPHAYGQMASDVGVPRTYLAGLSGRGDWGRELAAHTLRTLFQHDESRHLVRSVKSQTRGFLSTKYRRLNSGMLLDEFLKAATSVGAVPYAATCTDTKWMVRAVCTDVLEPVPNEVIVLGVVIHESPFGNGATEVSPFIERKWCTNQAICTEELRRVHLGARLADGVAWADDTMQADTRLLALQTRDLVHAQLGAPARERLCATVRAANERKVDPAKFGAWIKANLSKVEAEGVLNSFNSPDVENMPAGNTWWRASNAVSWFAHSVTDEERRFELNKLAGEVAQRAAVQ